MASNPEYPFSLFGSLAPEDRNPFDFSSRLPVAPKSRAEELAALLTPPAVPPSTGLFGLGLAEALGLKNDNPFARNSLADLLIGLQPSKLPVVSPPSPAGGLGALGGFFDPPPSNPFAGIAAASTLSAVAKPQPVYRLPVAPPPVTARPVVPAKVKRKAFFSFHYDDIMRVNVVRNAWKIGHPDTALIRSFYDSSLWESRKLEGDASLKRLIREGVQYTSAVCVLVGSDTWVRPWVRYEIARAIIDGRGLVAVHLNSIRHHHERTAHTRGLNPLDYMAVGKVRESYGTRYYLFERIYVADGRGGYRTEWHRYAKHREAVARPRWLNDPAEGYVTPLSENVPIYDYIADVGHKNIGGWIDRAASRAGR